MRNVSDKIVYTVKTHISCSVALFRKYYRLWQNVENYWRARQATDDNTIQRMRSVYWITKATDTHREYVTLVACPVQQWLRESASILRYACTACLAFYNSTQITGAWRYILHRTKTCQPTSCSPCYYKFRQHSLLLHCPRYVLHLTVEPAASLLC